MLPTDLAWATNGATLGNTGTDGSSQIWNPQAPLKLAQSPSQIDGTTASPAFVAAAICSVTVSRVVAPKPPSSTASWPFPGVCEL